MQTGKNILKTAGWIAGIGSLVLISSVALTQYQKKYAVQKDQPVANEPAMSAVNDEDSVEIVGTPTGEDPWKEVTKLVDAYYSKNGMEYKGSIKVIDDNGDKEKVLEVQPFEYTILNNDYYYRLAHMEVVNKKNFLMAIDNENKTVRIAKNVMLHKTTRMFDMRAFKKIMEKGNAHALITRNGNEKILTIDNIPDADIQGYRIYYSAETYRVHKMLIGMVRLSSINDDTDDQVADNPKQDAGNEEGVTSYYYYLEVLFSQVQPLALKENDFNPENKFIQVQNGGITLTPAFKEYQLLNTIEP